MCGDFLWKLETENLIVWNFETEKCNCLEFVIRKNSQFLTHKNV
jgi:hypothetical protein